MRSQAFKGGSWMSSSTKGVDSVLVRRRRTCRVALGLLAVAGFLTAASQLALSGSSAFAVGSGTATTPAPAYPGTVPPPSPSSLFSAKAIVRALRLDLVTISPGQGDVASGRGCSPDIPVV